MPRRINLRSFESIYWGNWPDQNAQHQFSSEIGRYGHWGWGIGHRERKKQQVQRSCNRSESCGNERAVWIEGRRQSENIATWLWKLLPRSSGDLKAMVNILIFSLRVMGKPLKLVKQRSDTFRSLTVIILRPLQRSYWKRVPINAQKLVRYVFFKTQPF